MKMTQKVNVGLIAACSMGVAAFCSAQTSPSVAATTTLAQSDAPYTEGTVWNLTMVKTKPGMSDDYLKGLAKTFKGTLDEAKKQNLIISYKVLLGDSAAPHDFDILLMVESRNMAAFDGAREKFDPISKKIMGAEDEQRQTMTKRLDVREILGTKLMREITLK